MTRRTATVARKLKQVDYDAVIHLTIRWGDCVMPEHLAHSLSGNYAPLAREQLNGMLRMWAGDLNTRRELKYAKEVQ